MFVTKIKSVLAVVLVVAALAGAAGLIYQTQAAEHPKAKEEQPAAKENQKKGEEEQAQPKQQPAKSDQERMVGNWFIMNDDSMRKGEMWVIDEDRILMDAKSSNPIVKLHFHQSPIQALAFSTDGKTFVTAGADHTVRIWKLPDGK